MIVGQSLRSCAWFVILQVSLAAFPPSTTLAACVPQGTQGNDTISCAGYDTTGIDALAGNDQAYIAVGAEVKVEKSVIDSFFHNDVGGGFIFDADAFAEMTRTANATALNMGVGEDTVNINGTALANATTGVTTRAVAETVLGSATSTSKAITNSMAIGIDMADAGNVTIGASGLIEGSATATADARAVTFAIGSGKPFADASATARAKGIFVGDGPASLVNEGGTIDVTATAKAFTDSASETYSAVLPTADTEGTKNAYAYAYGIQFGDKNNNVRNHGTIDVTAKAEGLFFPLPAPADSFAVSAAWTPITVVPPLPANALAEQHSASEAHAYGIDVGDGQNLIENVGTINVLSQATAEASALAQVLSIPILWEAEAHASAVATAVGINTGSGDNVILNYGAINVTARVDADARAVAFTHTSSEDDVPESTGILTGDGDDVVSNFGSIVAEYFRSNGARTRGTSIDTGAGKDVVILGDSSFIYGYMKLRGGDDTLKVFGTPTVAGNAIDGGAGCDTIEMNGNGALLSSVLMQFEAAVKLGAGSYTLSNLPSVQTLNVLEGSLILGSPYSFAASGAYTPMIHAGDNQPRLQINGGTTLGGAIEVLTGGGLFEDGSRYPVVTASGGIAGSFGSVSLRSTPLLSFTLDQQPSAVDVVASAKPFQSVAANRVEWAVAGYMDSIASSATGDLSDVLGEFQQMPESDYETGFSSLSPDSYDNFTLSTYRVVREYTHGIRRRLADTRRSGRDESDGKVSGFHQLAPLVIAFNGAEPELGRLFEGVSEQSNPAEQGLWVDAYGLRGDQDDERRGNWSGGGYQGFDFRTYGITLGYGRRLTDQWMAGLSFGYAKTDVDLDNNAGDGDIDSKMVSLYGEYHSGSNYMDTIIIYGKSDYDNKRNVKIGSIERTARSNHDGDIFSAAIEGGREVMRENARLEPFLSLQYIHLDEDDFEESGAGGVSLNIDGGKTESLVSQVGIRASTAVDWKNGRLITDAGLAWVHDFDIDDRVITASYAGAPQTALSVKGRDIARNGASVSFGVSYQTKSNLTASIRVGAEIRDNYHDEGIIGQLQYRF